MVDRLAHTEINNQRIAHVETCFGTSGQPLQEQGRVLVGEGVLTKLCRKKPKLRQFFLFNDILVYGSIVLSKKRYNKQHIMPLKHIRVEEIHDGDALVTQEVDGKDETLKNGWLIISPTKSFAVYAQTAMEKKEWMSHMNRSIEEQRMKAGITTDTPDVAPPWIPDVEAEHCMRCKKTRFSTINRRHHCRKCGFVVCKSCSTQRAVIPYQSTKPIRVCDDCFESISSNPRSVERVSPAKKSQSFFARNSGRPKEKTPNSNVNGDTASNSLPSAFGDVNRQMIGPDLQRYMDSSDSDSDDENANSTNTPM